MKIIEAIVFFILLCLGIYFGFFLGERETNEKRNLVLQVTFEPVKDCLIEINYSGRLEGIYWTVSDLYLINKDYEKYKNRVCEAEVGEVLHKFLEENKD